MNLQTASKNRLLSHPVLICLLLALATFFVYSPVRSFDFIDFDDNVYFFDNSHVLGGFTWANVQWAFAANETGNWHPLTWFSLMLDAQLFGHGASAPHLVNVLFHLANAILVFLLFRQMTGAQGRSTVLALLFALHPLHVESVAWIAERKDVLSSFFGLLTLLFYARHATCDRAQPGSSLVTLHSSLIIALFFFVCGLMSKSMVITLPFVMFLLDFWPLQRFGRLSTKRLLIEKIPFLLLIGAASILTFLAQRKGNAVTPLALFPVHARIENAFVSYARYLAKIFWPANLVTPYPPPIPWPWWLIIFSVALFVFLCVAAVALRKKYPFGFTGWFWFAGMLVPVIGLVQVGAQSMADRYVYLPIIGILLIVVWGVAEYCDRQQAPRGAIIFGVVVLCLACAVTARCQVSLWRNSETLFSHALVRTTNNSVASHNLGYWYEKNGQPDKAMDLYFDSDQLLSRDPTKLYNAGNVFAKLGHWQEAIKVYRRALELSPNQPDILNNLGFALTQNKQLLEATACFETVLTLQPNSVDAHNNLATVLFRQGKLAEAATQFSDALQLSPGNFQICANLAGTYEGLGQTNLAIQYYQQALRLQPGNQKIRAHLQSFGVPTTN